MEKKRVFLCDKRNDEKTNGEIKNKHNKYVDLKSQCKVLNQLLNNGELEKVVESFYRQHYLIFDRDVAYCKVDFSYKIEFADVMEKDKDYINATLEIAYHNDKTGKKCSQIFLSDTSCKIINHYDNRSIDDEWIRFLGRYLTKTNSVLAKDWKKLYNVILKEKVGESINRISEEGITAFMKLEEMEKIMRDHCYGDCINLTAARNV